MLSCSLRWPGEEELSRYNVSKNNENHSMVWIGSGIGLDRSLRIYVARNRARSLGSYWCQRLHHSHDASTYDRFCRLECGCRTSSKQQTVAVFEPPNAAHGFFMKKAFAAAPSRVLLSLESIVLPALSLAR